MVAREDIVPEESLKPDKRISKSPQVSIIIPIRRGENIIQTLACIWDSTHDHLLYEIIVVDEGLERSAQRNIGIRKAKGKYLLILDSDQLLTRGLLEECVYMMKEYDALYIPETMVGTDWFSRLRDFERWFYTNTPVDAVRFVKNTHCPMFDETMHGPEDSDWDRRVPGKRGVTQHYIRHNDRSTLWEYLKKKAYYARSMKKYEAKNKGDKVVSFKWRCIDVFLENGKWRVFLRHPIKAMGVMMLVFVRGVIYLWCR
jgi:glycosyltransferase involved in cell wall biosynthesis